MAGMDTTTTPPRPGPERIPPDSCPGGIVFHVYGVPSCELLIERMAATPADAAAHAEQDAADAFSMTNEDVYLVFFDGDTGERRTMANYLS